MGFKTTTLTSKNVEVPAALLASLERFRCIPIPWSDASAIRKSGSVHELDEPNVECMSSLCLSGNLCVRTGMHDGGFLLVRGDLRCRNLIVASGFTFVCTGTLYVEESIIATAGDSVTQVGGEVHARFLDSGSGAWLSVYRDNALQVENLCGYVMFGSTPVKTNPVNLYAVLVAEAIESEEWDSMTTEEQEEEAEYKTTYIRVDHRVASKALAQGKSILRAR